MKLLASFLLIVLTGCTTAQMISRPGQASAFGPSNENSRVGTIKYLNQGADQIIALRRKDAYKQMYASCHSKYKIVSEGPSQSGGVATSLGASTFYSSNEYWYINFQCD